MKKSKSTLQDKMYEGEPSKIVITKKGKNTLTREQAKAQLLGKKKK